MLDVLILLAVPRRLLERFDNQRGGGRYDGDGGLTVIDGQSDGYRGDLSAPTINSLNVVWFWSGLDLAYPVSGRLGDILTDLLRRETERTDLGCQSGRGTDLTSSGAEVNDLLLIRVDFGS